jgi:predicted HNH restriction endonuclease
MTKKIEQTYYERNKEKVLQKKRERYEKNKDKIIAGQLEKYRQLRHILNDWRKSLSCEVCGENDEVCLDFHHCESDDKVSNVGSIVNQGAKAVIRELKKCVVVCCNCHRKIHAYDLKTTPNISLSEEFEKFYNDFIKSVK